MWENYSAFYLTCHFATLPWASFHHPTSAALWRVVMWIEGESDPNRRNNRRRRRRLLAPSQTKRAAAAAATSEGERGARSIHRPFTVPPLSFCLLPGVRPVGQIGPSGGRGGRPPLKRGRRTDGDGGRRIVLRFEWTVLLLLLLLQEELRGRRRRRRCSD